MSSSPTDTGVAPGTNGVPGTADRITDVLMPQMGTSVAEGTIVAWSVAPGDRVVRDQVLCEVSTDKVDVECPAAADGVLLEILVDAGETVDVGTAIARLATADAGEEGDGTRPAADGAGAVADHAAAAADHAAAAAARPEATLRPQAAARAGTATGADGTDAASGATVAGDPGVAGGLVPDLALPEDPRAARRDALRRSSPVAARLAAEHGVDVRAVTGSGRNGRVTKRDVLAAAQAAGSRVLPTRARAPQDPVGHGPAAQDSIPRDGPSPGAALMHTESPYRHDPSIPVAGAAAPAAVPAGAPPVVPADLGGHPVPASRMRRSIGQAVRRSLDTAAHCTTIVECDMSRVERERRELGLTALPLVARHAIETLLEFPALNATFDGETVTRFGDRVHLGIAVSLGEDGLIAPVIHDAQDLSVQGLARRIKDLAARARAGRLSPDEVRGGTFTITNPGAAGALMATPVINLPQVAILDLEAIVRRPVVVTDPDGGESIGIRPMVHLCMGWDHRALDGLYAAQFLTSLRRRVEG